MALQPSIRYISLPIIANGRYCNNDCQFMAPDAKSCSIFGNLIWNHKRKSNGNHRPIGCRRAEIPNPAQLSLKLQ